MVGRAEVVARPQQQRHKGTLFFLLVFLLVLSARNKLESSIHAGFKAFFDSLRRTTWWFHTTSHSIKTRVAYGYSGFFFLQGVFLEWLA